MDEQSRPSGFCSGTSTWVRPLNWITESCTRTRLFFLLWASQFSRKLRHSANGIDMAKVGSQFTCAELVCCRESDNFVTTSVMLSKSPAHGRRYDVVGVPEARKNRVCNINTLQC